MSAQVARIVQYSGRVQGVGFRAATQEIAQRFLVAGYVRNLADGRVQVLVEGDECEVTRFLSALRDYWRRHVDSEQVEERAPNGNFSRFDIAR